MTTLTSFFKTDLVDDHTANDMNVLIAAALRPEYANTETITATKTLTDNDTQFQFLTASGADRSVLLAPEATSNHVTIVYNAGASNNIIVKDDSATTTFATLAADQWQIFYPLNAKGWKTASPTFATSAEVLTGTEAAKSVSPDTLNDVTVRIPFENMVMNGKLSVTVASNNLTVALKTLAGADPSASDPVYVRIGSTVRTVTAALSVTKNAGTNWCNAGGAELATKEIDYFVYLIWNTTPATDIVDIGFARIPTGRVYSDFSGTSTNEKYLASGNASAPTSTDDVVNIGRFAATLSAGAGYTWTVPSFTTDNLRNYPIYETRLLSWTPTHSRTGGAYTNAPTTSDARYQIMQNRMMVYERHTQNAVPGSSGNQTITLPFNSALTVAQVLKAFNATTTIYFAGVLTASSSTLTLYKYDGTAEATASQVYIFEDMVFI